MAQEIRVGAKVLCIGSWPAKKLEKGMVGEVLRVDFMQAHPYQIRWTGWVADPQLLAGQLNPQQRAGKPLSRPFVLEHLMHHQGTVFRLLEGPPCP